MDAHGPAGSTEDPDPREDPHRHLAGLIVLSPHFDDAVLSCGGLIHHAARQGRHVEVLTVCAGDPPPGPLSPFAASLHARWELESTDSATPTAVAARRSEDARALARLGAQGAYLDLPDAIYRRAGPGASWLVTDLASLFAGEDAAEPDTVEALAGRFGPLLAPKGTPDDAAEVLVLAPLAVGGHLDHVLVRRAAQCWASSDPQRLARLRFYEDYPYAEDEAALARSVSGVLGAGAICFPWTLETQDLEAKIEATAAYRSQISSFWADEAAMARALRSFAARSGAHPGAHPGAERLWRVA